MHYYTLHNIFILIIILIVTHTSQGVLRAGELPPHPQHESRGEVSINIMCLYALIK